MCQFEREVTFLGICESCPGFELRYWFNSSTLPLLSYTLFMLKFHVNIYCSDNVRMLECWLWFCSSKVFLFLKGWTSCTDPLFAGETCFGWPGGQGRLLSKGHSPIKLLCWHFPLSHTLRDFVFVESLRLTDSHICQAKYSSTFKLKI